VSFSLRKGQQVEWSWGSGTASGTIADRFERSVKRTLEGSAIVRNGSKDDLAYLNVQSDGDKVLKLSSELSAAWQCHLRKR
jgi:hypothetical protein